MSNQVVLSAYTFTTDTDALNWRRRVYREGGTVSDARLSLVNTLIAGLKTDAVWSKLDRLWLFAAEVQTAALVDLKGGTLATAISSPTFAVDRGFTSATGKYVDTNYIPSTSSILTQNNAHAGIWIADNPDNTTNTRPLGCNDASNHWIVFQCNGTGNYGYGINEIGTGGVIGSGSAVAGHWLCTRASSTVAKGYLNATQPAGNADDAATSTAPPTTKIYVGLMDINGALDTANTSRIAGCHFGSSLSSTDVSNLYTRLRTYMTAVGVP